jgi:hypothetical protein
MQFKRLESQLNAQRDFPFPSGRGFPFDLPKHWPFYPGDDDDDDFRPPLKNRKEKTEKPGGVLGEQMDLFGGRNAQ